VQIVPNLIADVPEHRAPLLFGALRRSGVLEIAMQSVRMAGENRATLLRVVADGEHIVEIRKRLMNPVPIAPGFVVWTEV